MIKTIKVGPTRQVLLSKGHENLLKTLPRLDPALGVSGGHYASLAWVMTEERSVSDPKWQEFIWCAKEAILPEWL